MSDTREQIQTQTDELDSRIDIFLMIQTFLREFRRFWWICVILGVLAGGFMYHRASSGFTPMYRSEASFTVTSGTSTTNSKTYTVYYDSSAASQMAATFPYILESELLTDLVKNELGVSALNGSISASAVADSNLFTLAVTSSDPQAAYDILNAVINHYGEVSRYVIGETQLNMIEEPKVATTPYNTQGGLRSGVKGALEGVILGMILIFLYGQLRRTIRREQDIRDILNVECAGIIPKVLFKRHRKEIDRNLSIENRYLGDGFRESIRAIAMRLDKTMKEKKQHVILVTSAAQKEGVTTMAENVALALAEIGNRVVLINGKILRSAEDFEGDPAYEFGLDDVLSGTCSVSEALHPHKSGRIEYMQCRRGLTRRKMISVSGLMGRLMHKLSHNRDYIVVDAPSCSRMEEVTFLAENSDCILFVIQQDFQTSGKITDALGEVCSYGSELFGCILNQVEEGVGSYGYGGKYYGNYSYRKYGYGRGRYGYGRKKYGYGYGYGGSRYGYGEDSNKEKNVAE